MPGLAWSKQQHLSILADPSQIKNVVKANVGQKPDNKTETKASAVEVDSKVNFSSVGFDGARDWRFRGTQITFVDGNNVIQRGLIVSSLNNQGTLLSVTGQDALIMRLKSVQLKVSNG